MSFLFWISILVFFWLIFAAIHFYISRAKDKKKIRMIGDIQRVVVVVILMIVWFVSLGYYLSISFAEIKKDYERIEAKKNENRKYL